MSVPPRPADDSCMDSFTAGQFSRAGQEWSAYRVGSPCLLRCEQHSTAWPFSFSAVQGQPQYQCAHGLGLWGSPSALVGEGFFRAAPSPLPGPAPSLSWASDFFVVIYDADSQGLSSNLHYSALLCASHPMAALCLLPAAWLHDYIYDACMHVCIGHSGAPGRRVQWKCVPPLCVSSNRAAVASCLECELMVCDSNLAAGTLPLAHYSVLCCILTASRMWTRRMKST